MVTTTSAYSLARYRVGFNEGLDGVVRISAGTAYATGALLFGGQAVLTAAHLFDEGQRQATVHFDTSNGVVSVGSSRVLVHPDFVNDSNHDLALVWLSQPAPLQADRYGLYRETLAPGQRFELVGYGSPGTGDQGAVASSTGPYTKLKAQNNFDADASELKLALGPLMAWTPIPGSQWMADFDNGLTVNDALGRLMWRRDLGLGLDEGFMARGDSGGPAFIDKKITGVASFLASLSSGLATPDVDKASNSSFGEVGAWQSIGFFQQWIDQSLRAQYREAPTRPSEVKAAIAEGHAGTVLVFFLLEFTGQRTSPDQWVSVDYATRDGSATAGLDYVATSGRLVLYPNETQAVIPVEIIGDRIAEPDEVFYLDVFNPIGGSLGPGVTQLVGMRTIADDDGWLAI